MAIKSSELLRFSVFIHGSAGFFRGCKFNFRGVNFRGDSIAWKKSWVEIFVTAWLKTTKMSTPRK